MTGPPQGGPSLLVLTFWQSKKCKHYVSSSAKAGCGLGVLWRAYEAGSRPLGRERLPLAPPRRFPIRYWTLAGQVQILPPHRMVVRSRSWALPTTKRTFQLHGLATPESCDWLNRRFPGSLPSKFGGHFSLRRCRFGWPPRSRRFNLAVAHATTTPGWRPRALGASSLPPIMTDLYQHRTCRSGQACPRCRRTGEALGSNFMSTN
jgi:hypothetical protein